jgi:hypothetical protein
MKLTHSTPVLNKPTSDPESANTLLLKFERFVAMKYVTYGEIMGTRAEKSSQNLLISVLARFLGAKQTMTLLYLPYVTADINYICPLRSCVGLG